MVVHYVSNSLYIGVLYFYNTLKHLQYKKINIINYLKKSSITTMLIYDCSNESIVFFDIVYYLFCIEFQCRIITMLSYSNVLEKAISKLFCYIYASILYIFYITVFM